MTRNTDFKDAVIHSFIAQKCTEKQLIVHILNVSETLQDNGIQ